MINDRGFDSVHHHWSMMKRAKIPTITYMRGTQKGNWGLEDLIVMVIFCQST